LLLRGNTEARPGQPVVLRLNERHLCPCNLQVMVGENLVNEPQALDGLAEEIARTWHPNGRSRIEVTLKGELGEFLAKEGVEKLLRFLAEHEVPDVEVVKVQSGSVKLTLTVPEDQAEQFFRLANAGALDQFGLLGLKYVPQEHEALVTIPGLDLEGYHGYLVQ